MLEELTKYQQNGRFQFKLQDKLQEVCNAPSDKSGVYLIYAVKKDKRELIYIGCSGKITKDGSMFIRKAGFGGIKDRLINGH